MTKLFACGWIRRKRIKISIDRVVTCSRCRHVICPGITFRLEVDRDHAALVCPECETIEEKSQNLKTVII
jgi:RNase P subunit RPR2